MLALKRTVMYAALLLLIAGCGNSALQPTPRGISLSAINGSHSTGVSFQDLGSSLRLDFNGPSQNGTFVRIEIVDGRRLSGSQLLAADQFLGLAVPTLSGAEVGVFPLPGCTDVSLDLPLTTAAADKHVSVPPVGAYNVITDLAVTDVGGGQIELSWTQINVGDYNFDGLVGITDLTPIGQLLGTVIDHAEPGASAHRAYWVDGNGDGQISVSDITPIGQNFGAYIAGYNIKHNGAAFQPAAPGEPTVPRSDGLTRDGLPPVFSKVVSGAADDEWAVVAVDKDGIEGSGSGGIIGDISLRANLDLSGINLFDLDGSNPGPFDPRKIGSRLIEPGEIIGVARWEAPAVDALIKHSDSMITLIGVPRQRILYLDWFYLPTVDLVTGDPRLGSSLHIPSVVVGVDYAYTTIPLLLPATGTTEMDIKLAFSPNPEGGYSSELTVATVYWGDNPTTPEIEESFSEVSRSRLNYATGLVSYDTDLDGDYEDEAELLDSDLDGISDVRLANDVALGNGELTEYGELKFEGILVSFNEQSGQVTLTETVLTEGGEGDLPDPLMVLISELTHFEEHIKTDEGVIKQDIDPGSLAPGDLIEVEMIRLEESGDPLPAIYRIEKLMRKLDQRT